MKKINLQGMKILITRPIQQAQFLSQAISELGGKPIIFPTVEIVETESTVQLQRVLQQLAKFDFAIFTSANAVWKTMPHWPKLNNNLSIIAIGPATTKALAQFKVIADHQPQSSFSSEALLQLPILQAIKDKRIVIFSGEGGRSLLFDALTQRGAQVVKAETYQRRKPDMQTSVVLTQNPDIAISISTSVESLRNLSEMIKFSKAGWLFNIPLLVISARISGYAHQAGFTNVVVAENPTDEGILAALKAWYANKI